ncbi:MAG TPA: M23 family metallopeptidase [Candidatus Limnocylindrales bacterium]|nr:M23 family metallopeptidase [Candidatus Limnocylindrales bacterium]
MSVRGFVILVALAAWAQTVPLPRIVKQGGTLRLHAPAGAVSATMNGRTVPLFPQSDGGPFGLMPVPANEKPGDYKLDLLDARGSVIESATVAVADAHFKKQNVVIEPALTTLKPAPGESEDASEFRKLVTATRFWSEPLSPPLRSCMTSPYGVQRYLNGKPTGDIHTGLDQRGAAGTPIHAVADGVVKLVRPWALHGNTVGIDHGQGLESMYLHMSRFAVAEGERVKKGDVIGYVGTTGRSNAPHLHWTLYVNGVPVNPLDWVHLSPCAPRVPAKK